MSASLFIFSSVVPFSQVVIWVYATPMASPSISAIATNATAVRDIDGFPLRCIALGITKSIVRHGRVVLVGGQVASPPRLPPLPFPRYPLRASRNRPGDRFVGFGDLGEAFWMCDGDPFATSGHEAAGFPPAKDTAERRRCRSEKLGHILLQH